MAMIFKKMSTFQVPKIRLFSQKNINSGLSENPFVPELRTGIYKSNLVVVFLLLIIHSGITMLIANQNQKTCFATAYMFSQFSKLLNKKVHTKIYSHRSYEVHFNKIQIIWRKDLRNIS